jgi:hypothetical protein
MCYIWVAGSNGVACEVCIAGGSPKDFECPMVVTKSHMVSCGKKVITSRISGPDKYQWVVLVVCWGAYSPIVGKLREL